MELETEVEREVGGDLVCLPIIVEFSVTKASRGTREHGVPMEPDYEAEVEIEAVYDSDTRHEVKLTKEEEKRIVGECWKQLDDMRRDFYEP